MRSWRLEETEDLKHDHSTQLNPIKFWSPYQHRKQHNSKISIAASIIYIIAEDSIAYKYSIYKILIYYKTEIESINRFHS